MRILHCIASVNPSGGGPIEGVKRLAVEMQRTGHSTEVVSLDDPTAPWVQEYQGALHATGPSHLRYGYTPRLVPWLKQNARHYDVVIVNGLWQYNSFGVWRAVRESKTPYVVFSHGMLDPWFKRTYPFKHIKKWLYWPWAEYRSLRDASTVIFTCEEERILARQSFWLYRCVESVVNYGTSDPAPLDPADREAFLGEFPELAGRRVMLFLSRIHRKKGCDNLIRAFASVAKLDDRLHLVMAGPDSTRWRPSLERLASELGISDRITWTGELRAKAKWGAFQVADAFVLFSHQENFGIAVAEALACGVPVLISDKVNIWREIEGDRAGLIGTDTVSGGVDILTRWLAMSEQARAEMRTQSRATFLARFEISRMAESLLGILRAHGVQHG